MLVREIEAYAAEVGAVAQVRGGGLEGDRVAQAAGRLDGVGGVGGGQGRVRGDSVPGEQVLGVRRGQGGAAGVGGGSEEALDERGGAGFVDVVVLAYLAGVGGLSAPLRVPDRLGQGADGPLGGGVGGNAGGLAVRG